MDRQRETESAASDESTEKDVAGVPPAVWIGVLILLTVLLLLWLL